MRNITKEEFAILTLYFDSADDILNSCNFNHEAKRLSNIITKNVKKLLKFSFGNEGMEDFDEYKISLYNYAKNIVSGNFHLSGEDEKKFENDVIEAIIEANEFAFDVIPFIENAKAVITSLNMSGFKIVRI